VNENRAQPSSRVLYIPRVGMVYVSEHAMLSERRREVRARKEKKKEGAWRGPRTLFFLFAAATASVLLLLLFAPLGQVEASGTELVHAYGGATDDIGFCVIEHSIDNGLVLAGTTDGTGTSDFSLIKTDSVGAVLWSKTYGGSDIDQGRSLIEHSLDQGLLLAGRTKSYGAGSYDMMLLKTNSVGIELWTRTYGTTDNEFSMSVMEHSLDNGLMIGGLSNTAGSFDFMLVKTNSVGIEVWTKTYGGSTTSEITYCVIEHFIDQGFLLAGYTNDGAGANDMMLMKTNSAGVVQWTKTYGGSSHDEAWSVIEHSLDQGLLLAGRTNSHGAGSFDSLLVKTNSTGVVQWAKTYGGPSSDEAKSVIEHSVDQGLFLAGMTSSYGAGNEDLMLVKTNSVGVVMWTMTYGQSGSEEAWFVMEHSIGNGIVCAGFTDSIGAGSDDIMLVIQPSDGSGTAGANATLTEGTQTLTEVDQTITGATQPQTENNVTLADADQNVTTTVFFVNPTPSRSPSRSSSASRTASDTSGASATASRSGTSGASATASRSGTSAASASASRTSGASATASRSGTSGASATASRSGTSGASATASRSVTSAASASASSTSGASASASQTATSSQTASQSASVSTSLTRTKTPIAAQCRSLPVQYQTKKDDDSQWTVIGCDNGQRIGSVCTLTCSGRLADQFKVECLTDTKWHYSQDSSGFQFVDEDDDDAVSDYTTDFVLEADTYDQVCYIGTITEPAGTGTKPEPDVYVVTLVINLIDEAQDTEEFVADLTVALKDDTFVALLEEADYSQEFKDFALEYVRDNNPFRSTSNGRRLLATDEEAVLDLINFVDESVVVEFDAKANGEIVIDIQLQVSGDQDIQSTDDGAGADPISLNLEDMVSAVTVTLNNENSTIARQFNVTSDSITSITIGKLCADGTVDDGEGSCDDAGGQVNSTSDNSLSNVQITIIAIVAVFVLITVVGLLYSKNRLVVRADKFQDVELDPSALQAPGAAPAPKYVEGGGLAHEDEKQEIATDNIKIEIY
jgi:hypothetical protein